MIMSDQWANNEIKEQTTEIMKKSVIYYQQWNLLPAVSEQNLNKKIINR